MVGSSVPVEIPWQAQLLGLHGRVGFVHEDLYAAGDAYLRESEAVTLKRVGDLAKRSSPDRLAQVTNTRG